MLFAPPVPDLRFSKNVFLEPFSFLKYVLSNIADCIYVSRTWGDVTSTNVISVVSAMSSLPKGRTEHHELLDQ